jgi:nucleolar protein 58
MFATPVIGCRLRLKGLHRFQSTATAVEDITALQEGKLGKDLKKFLKDNIVDKGKTKESLVVVDHHLGLLPSCI